jgi:hypothetical protein
MEMSKEEAQKLLSNVPDHRVFRCCDGRVIRNIRDLGKTLAHMPDDSFRYHANQEKNDFSRWVKETVGDEKLAKNLYQAVDKRQALKELSHRISFLSGRLAN